MSKAKTATFHLAAGAIVLALVYLFAVAFGPLIAAALAGSVAILFREAGEAEKHVPGKYPARIFAIAKFMVRKSELWQWAPQIAVLFTGAAFLA